MITVVDLFVDSPNLSRQKRGPCPKVVYYLVTRDFDDNHHTVYRGYTCQCLEGCHATDNVTGIIGEDFKDSAALHKRLRSLIEC